MTRPTLLEMHTERLDLRPLTLADAPQIRALVTDPDWIRFVGDRNVHSDEDAARYLRERLLPAYEKHGFGFLAVIERVSGAWCGICGLIQRDTLDTPDVGYALLPSARGKGYARESAGAVLRAAHETLGFARVQAMILRGHTASRQVLEGIGMQFDRIETEDDPPVELEYFVSDR